MQPDSKDYLLGQLYSVLTFFKEVLSHSKYDDLSDLKPSDVSSLIAKSMSAIDRICPQCSTYSKQANLIIASPEPDATKALQLKGLIESLKSDVEAGFMKNLEELPQSVHRDQTLEEGRPTDQPRTDPHKVFVVYGRNTNARDAIFALLESLHLIPQEWPSLVVETDGGSPYLLEIVNTGVATAQAVIVLLTPDEIVQLRQEYRKKGSSSEEAKIFCQPRPNVFFEAGMALVTHPGKTIFLQLGDLRPFSDIQGKYIIPWNNSAEVRKLLADKLREIGCLVSTDGDRWLSAGQIDIDSLSLSNHERKDFFQAALDLTAQGALGPDEGRKYIEDLLLAEDLVIRDIEWRSGVIVRRHESISGADSVTGLFHKDDHPVFLEVYYRSDSETKQKDWLDQVISHFRSRAKAIAREIPRHPISCLFVLVVEHCPQGMQEIVYDKLAAALEGSPLPTIKVSVHNFQLLKSLYTIGMTPDIPKDSSS